MEEFFFGRHDSLMVKPKREYIDNHEPELERHEHYGQPNQ
jgi:hypothetical protein